MAKTMKRVLLVALSVLMVLAALASCEVPGQEKTYTITFQNEDGTVLETVTVKEGETPVYTQAEPTKEATDANSYTFAGWDKEIVPADADATYTATFDATEKTYTIRFVDADGSLIDEQTLKFGDTPVYIRPTPTKPADAEFTYTFAGWDKEIAPVSGDTTYTATYSTVKNTYTVIFMNGTVELKNETLEYGATPAAPANPTKPADAEYTYTFTGWDKEIAAVAGDVTYTAQFSQTKNSYTITFKNDDGSVIETQTVEYGALPQAPTATKESTDTNSYEFKGWDNEVVAVTGDATYTATYTVTARKYTITFLDADGTTVLKEEKLEIGQTPTAPADPTKDATAEFTYTFAGWDNGIVAVTGDATYTATYTSAIRTYDVVFYATAADGTQTPLYTDEDVAYGEMPEYKGATPTMYNELFYWEFKGWDFPLEAVTGDNLSYTALFNKICEFKLETVTTTDESGNKIPATWGDTTRILANIQKDTQYLFTLLAASEEYADKVDYTKHEKNLSFTVTFNYSGITITDLNGNLIATSVKDTAIKLVITNEGKVYANDELVEDATMQNGVVSFYINRNATEHQYAQAIFSPVEYDVEIKEPEVKNWTALDVDIASGMSGTRTDVTLTDTETALGITSVKEYTFTGTFQNSAFASLDLTQYESVKFYMYRPSTGGAGSIYDQGNGASDGGIVFLSNYTDQWVEIELRQGTSGYDIYANGEKKTFTLKSGSSLTNLNQLALNGSSGTVKYSNVLAIELPVSTEPEPENPVTITIGDDGAISGDGVTAQTITLTTTRVWNLSDSNAQTVTVSLSDASAIADALTINGVKIGSSEETVKINSMLYLVGKADYSVAGQVSFKLGYIQDSFYFNTDSLVSFKNLTEADGVYTAGSMYNLTSKSDSKITTEEGVSAHHANAQRIDGVWYDNWRLTLNKSGNRFSFYLTFNYSGAQLYAKDGIGDDSKLIHTFTANEVILVTILKDGSVLINGVDSGVDTSTDNFILDFYNGGETNAYGTFGMSSVFWRDNNV